VGDEKKGMVALREDSSLGEKKGPARLLSFRNGVFNFEQEMKADTDLGGRID